ncbi:MAG: terminase family protein [Spirochaetaceae bacterium]|jgi:hypothetical protein|nr:terminase family protein [Spirochaetaceae bacterium]
MGTTVVFKPTAIQRKALALLKGGAKHILLFGGSRSGKTTVLVMAIIFRVLMYAGSRHLICRYRAKDARLSVLRETLMPWLDNTVGKSGYTYLAHESMITLFNGSEIWIGGLGDREQADKILGHEYNTVYFNEISQLSYAAVTTAYCLFTPFYLFLGLFCKFRAQCSVLRSVCSVSKAGCRALRDFCRVLHGVCSILQGGYDEPKRAKNGCFGKF